MELPADAQPTHPLRARGDCGWLRPAALAARSSRGLHAPVGGPWFRQAAHRSTRVRRQRGARREAAEVRGALGSGWGCAAREDGDPGAATAMGLGDWREREPHHLLPGAGVRLAAPAPSRQSCDLRREGDGIRTQFFSNLFPRRKAWGGNLRIRYREGIKSGEQGTRGDFLSLDLRWDKTRNTSLCGALHFPEPSSEQLS